MMIWRSKRDLNGFIRDQKQDIFFTLLLSLISVFQRVMSKHLPQPTHNLFQKLDLHAYASATAS